MARKKAEKNFPGLSRREFARRAALLTAAVIAPSARASVPPEALHGGEMSLPGTEEPALVNLSPANRARFEAMLGNVLRKHGDRFTEEQKNRLRKIIAYNVRMLEAIYAVPLRNGDTPATLLKLLGEEGGGRGLFAAPPRPAPARKMNAKPRKGEG